MKGTFDTAHYDFELPEELIARYPTERREEARLMVVDRASGSIEFAQVKDLARWLKEGDQLICNESEVVPARLKGRREGDKECELLLCPPEGGEQGGEHRALSSSPTWKALVKPARHLKVGGRVKIDEELFLEVVEELPEGLRRFRVISSVPRSWEEILRRYGEIPLPPYLRRPPSALDLERYQTVFACKRGSVAAPTAGLHFTPALLEQIAEKGGELLRVTLHVGLATFAPVRTEDLRDHVMHTEWCTIEESVAHSLNRRRGRRIAIGTTACRTLESMSDEVGVIASGCRATNLFIYPGYRFKAIDALFTNFHWPRSTLVMLVAAWMGHELWRESYVKAIEEKVRFFSYGDAMLIL